MQAVYVQQVTAVEAAPTTDVTSTAAVVDDGTASLLEVAPLVEMTSAAAADGSVAQPGGVEAGS